MAVFPSFVFVLHDWPVLVVRCFVHCCHGQCSCFYLFHVLAWQGRCSSFWLSPCLPEHRRRLDVHSSLLPHLCCRRNISIRAISESICVGGSFRIPYTRDVYASCSWLFTYVLIRRLVGLSTTHSHELDLILSNGCFPGRVTHPSGWEHISQFIAQATRAKDPFSKEDCIAKYQQIHAAPAGPQKIVAPSVAAAAAPASAKSAPERPSRREPRVRHRHVYIPFYRFSFKTAFSLRPGYGCQSLTLAFLVGFAEWAHVVLALCAALSRSTRAGINLTAVRLL